MNRYVKKPPPINLISRREGAAINERDIVCLQDVNADCPGNFSETPNDKAFYPSTHSISEENKDYFIEQHGIKYAGKHLIIDLWEASNLDNLTIVENALRETVEVCGATLLHIHLHHFTPNGGISGVAVLAESHISIHSWPERRYAALDIFMCGHAEPNKSLAVLQKAFNPKNIFVNEQKRGQIYERPVV